MRNVNRQLHRQRFLPAVVILQVAEGSGAAGLDVGTPGISGSFKESSDAFHNLMVVMRRLVMMTVLSTATQSECDN